MRFAKGQKRTSCNHSQRALASCGRLFELQALTCGTIMCCVLPHPTQLAQADAMMLVSKTLAVGGAMSPHYTSGQEAHGQVGPLRISPDGESMRALRVQEVPSLARFSAVGPSRGRRLVQHQGLLSEATWAYDVMAKPRCPRACRRLPRI